MTINKAANGQSTSDRTIMTARREQVAKLYCRGASQMEVARQVGVSQATISFDLKALRAQWMASSIASIDEKKSIELAKIDNMEIEYWSAWERSLEKSESETTEQVGRRDRTTGDTQITPDYIKKIKRVDGQSGNPAYLTGVQWCINKRCEILGLNAPTRNEHTGKNGEPIVITDEQHDRAVSTLASALGNLISASGTKPGDSLGTTE